MLGSHLSLGLNFYGGGYEGLMYTFFVIEMPFRVYLGKAIFLGVSLGYGFFNFEYGYNYDGITLTPEFGFRVDFGDPGGFFIEFGVRVPSISYSFVPSCIFLRIIGVAF